MEKWQDSLFLKGEDSIKEYFSGTEKILLFIGKGFDPRACRMLETVIMCNQNVEVCMIDYDDKATVRDDMTNESRSRSNYKKIRDIVKNIPWKEIKVPLYGGNGSKKILVISESVRGAITEELISNCTNIIVDISAMPRGVSFSIINRLIKIKSTEQKLNIAVCENSKCDDKIQAVIVEDSAEYLTGFNTFSMSLESEAYETVWIPVMGMNEKESFGIIANYLQPVEICPVVPFPSIDIQRGERILRANGMELFQEWNVEKRNIIYVPENYPLLVYHKLYETVRYYEKAFSINKNRQMKYAFSSQSSKLIDIGVLLAMICLVEEGIRTGIIVTENQGYLLEEEFYQDEGELFCLCLDEDEFSW